MGDNMLLSCIAAAKQYAGDDVRDEIAAAAAGVGSNNAVLTRAQVGIRRRCIATRQIATSIVVQLMVN